MTENNINTPEEYKYKSFEESLSRLENILSLMERGKLTLDESIKLFKEGAQLYKFCRQELEKAQHEIKLLTQGIDGSIIEKEFDSPILNGAKPEQ